MLSLCLCIKYEHQVWQRWDPCIWNTAWVPLPVSESVTFASLCLKSVIQFLFMSRGMLFHPLSSINIRPIKWEFKNSILTSSDWLLTCHKSDYLHPRWARHTDVSVINTSTLLLEPIREKQKPKLLRVELIEEIRGKMQVIIEWALILLVIFFFFQQCWQLYTWTIYTLKAFPVRGVHGLREKNRVLNNQG